MICYLGAAQNRRSVYVLDKNIVVEESKVVESLEKVLKNSPSAFNSQGSKAVVLLGEKHDRLWNILLDIMKSKLDSERFEETAKKLNMFKSAYGTVLYYENQETIKGLQDKFPSYAANFPIWANQSNAMLQYGVWTTLAGLGLGANLQHYNEMIEDVLYDEFGIERKYKLVAQMPFGNPVSPAGEKSIDNVEERFVVLR